MKSLVEHHIHQLSGKCVKEFINETLMINLLIIIMFIFVCYI